MRLSSKNLIVPLLPMREEIIYPGSTTPFFVGRKSSMEALDKALSGDRQIIVVAQRVSSVEEPKDEDLYEVGVLGRILQVMRLPNGTVKALFEGQHRARVLESMLRDKDYSARIEIMDAKESEKDLEKLTDLSTKARVLAREYFKKKKSKTREEVLKNIEDTEPHSLADRLASMMEIERELKQKLLEEIKPIGLISSSSFCFNSRSISIIEAKRSASEWGSVSSMFFNTSSRVFDFFFLKYSRARTRALVERSVSFSRSFSDSFASIISIRAE